MSHRIVLWKPKPTRTSDDAGTNILQYELPTYVPGPYEELDKTTESERLTYIPSLRALCIRKLVAYPDQLDWYGNFRIPYEKPKSPSDYDLVRSLAPGYLHEEPDDVDFLKEVDPRLWAVMVQTISSLPKAFRTYHIPLSDIHVPLLQQIPSTPDFSLITVVQFYGRREVDDETIDKLGALHSLAALDIGRTPVSSWGVKRLSHTLLTDDPTGNRRGPWGLRVLYLWDCMLVDDAVFEALPKFPLLSVVDLRGTKCTSSSAQNTFFGSPPDLDLFHPTPLPVTLRNLATYSSQENPSAGPKLFSHPTPYILNINDLHHIPSRDPKFRALLRSTMIVEQALLAMRPRPARAVFGSRTEVAVARSRNGRMTKNTSDPPTKQRPDPLMLFRSPPPYISSSPARPPRTHRSIGRHRAEEATAALYGEHVRGSKKAKESVQSVLDLVGKKVESASSIAGPFKSSRDVRDNPFLRKAKSMHTHSASIHSGIDPDLLATAERDRTGPVLSKSLSKPSKVALGKQPQRSFPTGDGFKEPTRARSSTGSISSRATFMPSIDPDLLASVEADRRREEKGKEKADKVKAKRKRKPPKRSSSPTSDLSDSDEDMTDSTDNDQPPPDTSGHKKSRLRLAPITAPPEKLKPLTALPIPQLPPKLHRKGYTEAEKAILLGTKVKRRKTEEPDNGLKQLTLAAFAKPGSSAPGTRFVIGSTRLSAKKPGVKRR